MTEQSSIDHPLLAEMRVMINSCSSNPKEFKETLVEMITKMDYYLEENKESRHPKEIKFLYAMRNSLARTLNGNGDGSVREEFVKDIMEIKAVPKGV
jgi:hypothetical protein